MKFDKEKCILFLLKAVSYTVNTVIVAAVVAGVAFFVYYLFMGGTAKIKKKPPHYGAVIERLDTRFPA
jgi:uncharacterized membrane-anchored protein